MRISVTREFGCPHLVVQVYRELLNELVAERIQGMYPQLSTEAIQAALHYWRENTDGIETEIKLNREALDRIPSKI